MKITTITYDYGKCGLIEKEFEVENLIGTKFYYTTEPVLTSGMLLYFYEYKGVYFWAGECMPNQLCWKLILNRSIKTDGDINYYLDSIQHAKIYDVIMESVKNKKHAK